MIIPQEQVHSMIFSEIILKEQTESSIILCVYFISVITLDLIYFYWHSIFTHVEFYSCCLV